MVGLCGMILVEDFLWYEKGINLICELYIVCLCGFGFFDMFWLILKEEYEFMDWFVSD